jgi:hypothetical protein
MISTISQRVSPAFQNVCHGHWRAKHPPPDPSAWRAIHDPERRLRIALGEIYAFYRTTEGMTGNILRDLPDSPVLREVAAPFIQYWQTVQETLDRGWSMRGHKRTLLRAGIGHAVAFETWRSLTHREGLEDLMAAEAMVTLARAIQT